MKRFLAVAVLMLSVFALAVTFLGTMAVTSTDAYAAPCRCPLVYSPVLCPNGKTYSNLCLAKCNHQTNCTPLPVF